jgi:serine/threonine-protein kinase
MGHDDPSGIRADAVAATRAETQPGTVATNEGAANTIVPMWERGDDVSLPQPGYELGATIGRGGMGEVVAAHDRRIGREVAVKRIRAKALTPDVVARFLREARIQARLDHPAIVPVYELGCDAEGRPYFTMKRLAGQTLATKLADGASVQRLLRAFIEVCLAIQLAHARDVVHRDLKPANIMLGDYGEVYVLDWGVARILGDDQRPAQPDPAHELAEGTAAGAILGTPGYMAPEQLHGPDVGSAADVYALGAILFEILAGQPLHPRGDAAIASTVNAPSASPATRAPERQIPPELDRACVDALAAQPAERPSARELADRVQAYLDGDRDLERRRALAAEQLESARDALEHGGDDARANAIRRAGRALALDPESTDAAELVTSLMLEPPKQLPSDLVHSLDAEEAYFNKQRARATKLAFLAVFVFWAIIPFMTVKSWTNLMGFYGIMALGAVSAAEVQRTGKSRTAVTLVLITAILLVFTRVAGPFVLTPIVACAIMISTSANPAFSRHRYLMVGCTVAALGATFVLEATHLIDRTWGFQNHKLVTISAIFELPGYNIDGVSLIVSNLVFIAVTALVAYSINAQRVQAQRQLHIQAWHLRQLIPQAKRVANKP